MSMTLDQMRARHGARYKWLVLLTVMTGSVAAILSSTIVNVAVPDISAHFALGQERAQWIATAFMLTMTLAMLLTPWLLLRFGLRRTYSWAVWLLLAGGVFGGLSVNFPMLLAMRMLEGLAAGVMQPIPAIVILRAFTPRQQGRAMGVYGFGVVLAPAIGPGVGGILVELFGWRSIFFVVVPFCLTVLLLIRRFLAVQSPAMSTAAVLDWKGLLLVGCGTVAMIGGLSQLSSGRAGAPLLACGVACIVCFVLYQLRGAPQPLLNMKLFGHRQFAMGALVSFIYGMALFGSTYLLPIFLQIALHYTPSSAGLLLLPPGLALAVTIPLAGKLADHFEPNRLVACGLVLLTGSFALMANASAATAYATLVAWAVLGRIGLACVLPALSLGAMRGIDAGMMAQGASAINFLRQLGGAIGVSLVGIVLEWRLAARGGAQLSAFNDTFLLVAVICGAAVAAAWRMRPVAGAARVLPAE